MRKTFMSTALAAAALAGAFVAAPLGAQITIGTTSPSDGVTPLGKDSDFGQIPTAIAETFVVPTGMSYLQTFNLFIRGGFGGGTSLNLDASIYEFDTDHLVGSALYSSGLFGGSDNQLGYDELTFGGTGGGTGNPLNVSLSSGDTYAIVLSSVEGYASTPDHSTITAGTTVTDEYAGGTLFISTVTDQASLSDPTAGAFFDASPEDAAFSATFTAGVLPTPEPSDVALLATGLVGLAAMRRRRRA